ncbi:RING finger and transmembrane domain-containing protein 2 [Schistocerca americana]|uniref:RING finger and transmembrane domain-containing protein 2 n=1 Tax=Schistocerca americana TaxID=7009 RepID=UPI001F4F5FD1|nr:RING finger and transmembrane domain-containing protein 2 [Schistocerca americana]
MAQSGDGRGPPNISSRFGVPFAMFGHRQAHHGLLMTHSVTPLGATTSTPRLIRENLRSVYAELTRTAQEGGLSSWLHGPGDGGEGVSAVQQRPQPVVQNDPTNSTDSIAISIDVGTPNASHIGSEQNIPETGGHVHTHINSGNNNNNNNNNNIDEGPAEILRQSPETREFLSILQKYIPFVLILCAKGLYDHRAGILIFLALSITACYSNTVLRREIGKQSRRSLGTLGLVVTNLLVCILGLYYFFEDQKLYLSLVFIPPYSQPLSMWDLLWIVGITDFVLKLATIIFKVLIAALPAFAVPYQRRGKYYLFVEATSQLYRCLAPIQPWLYYLLESYQGPEKVVGVFLSAAYMVSKGTDLMVKVRLWRAAFWKLLQNVNLGMSPSKEQLQSAGGQCPICHDNYAEPVLLQCRHIFCEACVSTWFDREQTCPLCRARVVDDPAWRDGSTALFVQLY